MKKKTRKTRKIKSYAMGSGNTGVIKNYMPDPSEVFRKNKIDQDRAIYEGASNPFVVGLKALAPMLGAAAGAYANKGAGDNMDFIKKNDGTEANMSVPSDFGSINSNRTMVAAKGTGPEGIGQVEINVERGEVLETPGGQITEEGGKLHNGVGADKGGNNRIVPVATTIFSDQVEREGKSMADWKKIRERKIAKLQKALDRDPTDAVAKETFRKSKEKFDYEEQQDLKLQSIAGEMDKMHEAVFGKGTGAGGVQSYSKGGKALGDFFGGFTAGDYLGLAGNIYSGLAPLLSAKKNAADNTVNENHFRDFGEDAISTIEDAGSTLNAQQSQAEMKLNTSRNTAIQRNRNSSRGINTSRALNLGTDIKYNESLSGLYTNFAKQMTENLYKKAAFQNQADQGQMQGAGIADIANRMDADNAATQIGLAESNMGMAIQQTGKDLNDSKRSQMLAKLTENLSKYGLIIDDQYNVIKGE